MLRRVALATRRLPAAVTRAVEENLTDPYMVDHIDTTLTQEDLEEELGYNVRHLNYTDECTFYSPSDHTFHFSFFFCSTSALFWSPLFLTIPCVGC